MLVEAFVPASSLSLAFRGFSIPILAFFLIFVQLLRAEPLLGVCYYNINDNSLSQTQYQNQFLTVQKLPGTSGWDAAELYTPLAPDGTLSPAIAAAVSTNTSLLLAICAVEYNNTCDPTPELNAIRNATFIYGSSFVGLLKGIIVEDYAITNSLNTPTGLASLVSQVKKTLSDTSLSAVPIGTREFPEIWVSSTVQPVIAASDFVFVRVYPMLYKQTVNVTSGIEHAKQSLAQVQNAAGSKNVWVSTGWPNTVTGTMMNFSLTPSATDAKEFYDTFGCGTLFNSVNTFWGTVEPTGYGDDILNSEGTPVHNLTCPSISTATSNSTTNSTTSTVSSISSAAATSGPANNNTDNNSNSQPDEGAGLSSSAKLGLGIGLGGGGGGLILIILIIWIVRRRTRRQNERKGSSGNLPAPQPPPNNGQTSVVPMTESLANHDSNSRRSGTTNSIFVPLHSPRASRNDGMSRYISPDQTERGSNRSSFADSER